MSRETLACRRAARGFALLASEEHLAERFPEEKPSPFSDAYHAEWCYPKLKLVKQVVLEILNERVARGWYSTDLALRIIRMLFYENPIAIYRFSSSQ